MLIAAIDTETTGLLRGDYTSSSAPYLASLTAVLYNTEAARVQASFNTMIFPEGWEMPPEAGAINGLDTEALSTFGIPLPLALQTLSALLDPAELITAHNVAFDVKVLASALYRQNMLAELDSLLGKEVFCTMQKSKPIVQAKNSKGHLKLPKLTEAYEFAFGRELDRAHSANADAIACLELYLWLQDDCGK